MSSMYDIYQCHVVSPIYVMLVCVFMTWMLCHYHVGLCVHESYVITYCCKHVSNNICLCCVILCLLWITFMSLLCLYVPPLQLTYTSCMPCFFPQMNIDPDKAEQLIQILDEVDIELRHKYKHHQWLLFTDSTTLLHWQILL